MWLVTSIPDTELTSPSQATDCKRRLATLELLDAVVDAALTQIEIAASLGLSESPPHDIPKAAPWACTTHHLSLPEHIGLELRPLRARRLADEPTAGLLQRPTKLGVACRYVSPFEVDLQSK